MATDPLGFGDDFFELEDKKTKTDIDIAKEVLAAPSVSQPAKQEVASSKEVILTPVPAVQPTNTIVAEDLFERTNEKPSLIGTACDPRLSELVERVWSQYLRLPNLAYEAVYTELSELTVKACPTPTLQVISEEMQKSQQAKDRVTELDIQVTQCLMLKDRAVSILREAAMKFSEEKSADKRKGDALYLLANFELDLAKTEALSSACKQVMRNLHSLQETLSRRITNVQLQVKLMDVGRNVLPDFDFSKKSMDIRIDGQDDNFLNDPDGNGPIPAKEVDL